MGIKSIAVLVVLLAPSWVWAWQCSPENLKRVDNLEAHYQVLQGRNYFQMVYARVPGKVAYHYPKMGMTEIWQKEPNYQMSLWRGFEGAGRAITYEATDLRLLGRAAEFWQLKQNLLMPALMKPVIKKTLLPPENGCERVQYQGYLGRDQVNLIWQPQLQLVLAATVKQASGQRMVYRLQQLAFPHPQSRVFRQLDEFDAMDFADVGDNEADPFIDDLLQQGAIEHPGHAAHQH